MMPLAAGEKKTPSTPRRPNIFPSTRNHYPKSGTTFESGEFFEHTTGVNWDVNYEHLLHPSAEVVTDLLMKLWPNQEKKRFRTIEYLGFCQPWSDRRTVWAEIGWTLVCLILWKLVPPGIRSLWNFLPHGKKFEAECPIIGWWFHENVLFSFVFHALCVRRLVFSTTWMCLRMENRTRNYCFKRKIMINQWILGTLFAEKPRYGMEQ